MGPVTSRHLGDRNANLQKKLGTTIRRARRTTMFKTISAALLAVSVLAAPAFAAGKIAQTSAKPVAAKTSLLNANARMGQHHTSHMRHHRHHIKYTAKRTHHVRVGFKHPAHVTAKRG
jgi:hypothetical protein